MDIYLINMLKYNWHEIWFLPLRDGQIKLFGKDNTQALLESNEISPSKFLQVLSSFPFIYCFACYVY